MQIGLRSGNLQGHRCCHSLLESTSMAHQTVQTLPSVLRTDVRASITHWQLSAIKKYADDGVTRSVPPTTTIRRALPILETIGVTRVSEVTGLDRIGIPNFLSVRPQDLGPGISYYNGKGTRRVDAYAGALMEAVERHAGEQCNYDMLVASYAEATKFGPTVDPRDIIVPTIRDFDDDFTLEWVQGFDLVNNQATFVPLNTVVCPYTPVQGAALYYASTNGLASGNVLIEALCHALCEVIERDALAIAMTRLRLQAAIDDVLADISGVGVNPARRGKALEFPLLHHRGLPLRAARLLGKMKRAGLTVYLRDMTSTAAIPTIDCTIIEQGIDGIPKAHGGCGTHPDARVALLRALTEAAQSRVACIQGGREDLPEIIRPTEPYDPDLVFGEGETVSFGDIQSYQHDYIDEDVRFLLSRLTSCGFNQIVVFDLTHPQVGIPVVRVVVPKAEAWPVFHLHTGRGVFGDRVAKMLRAQIEGGT
jgi:ribosomal protein S12 methylthiotransferase accessory factor YcaO